MVRRVNDKLSRLWATKNKDDEWWSSFVTAPLAVAVNYMVVDIKWLTPNLLTLFSLLIAIVSVGFMLVGGTANFIIAAVLIHLSHVLDCMDGQMARYRKTPSQSGSFFDKLTDQIQVFIWFGGVGYAAYAQSQNVLPVFLAFTGVAFYTLRGYTKYVAVFTQMENDRDYLERKSRESRKSRKAETAGLGFGVVANLRWFVREQPKILSFDEGVFVFMLSAALVFDALTPMLWVFAVTQVFYGLKRGWQRGCQIERNEKIVRDK
jgi:phosphatidylglycerophosphate synthase